MYAIALLLLLIIFCQWTAWRFRLPAIVLLTVSGLLLGPVFGWVKPAEAFGAYWPVLIAVSVAVILFDGGLNLNFRELRTTKRAVHQLIWIGAPLAGILNACAAHYIGGLSWPAAKIFGCILIVTGPTVIMPMLRQAKLNPRAASLLKWEGIFNDPLGVILTVLVYEHFVTTEGHAGVFGSIAQTFYIFFIALVSWGVARLLVWSFIQGHVPEYLKPPAVLASVVFAFALANSLHDEGGLLAVTVMGITMANSRLPSLEEIKKFKEAVSLLLVSLIFIFITATLTRGTLLMLGWRDLMFILCIMFVTRPLTVWVATIGAGLSWKERAFAGWIAPRGVVCAVISGFFGSRLSAQGIADGDKMLPLAFGIVFATVVAHGFTIRRLGARLGLVAPDGGGLLIVGAAPWTVMLAKLAIQKGIRVLIADANWARLRLAREENIPTHYGNMLFESRHDFELHEYNHLLAATDDFAFNGLLCGKFTHEFERNHLFQITGEEEERKDPRLLQPHLFGRTLLEGLNSEVIANRLAEGWSFKSVNLTENFSFGDYLSEHGDVIPALAVLPQGYFTFIRDRQQAETIKNGTIISLVSPKKAVTEKASPLEVSIDMIPFSAGAA